MDAVVLQERMTLSEMNGSGAFGCAACPPATVHLRNEQADLEIPSISARISLVNLNPSNRGPHEHDHHQRRHPDLLQGLGHRTARCLQPRLAALLRRVRGPDVLSRIAR